MEAIGQLTGGIAHDFNNMLQVIAGGLELIELRVAQGRLGELQRYFESTRRSLDSAASLTRRLMGFARREALRPRPIEPDALARGMRELLGRTLGPEITLEMPPAGGDWRALGDPHQLEAALLNLAINARDAMPEGGTLTITTADRHIAAAELQGPDDPDPGDYVEFAVADTGVGMTPEVMARVFEPFFTTKPVGAGTGLGLSQLYGFVRQSRGFARIESAPGRGTTVRLYLPRCLAADLEPSVEESIVPAIERPPAGGRDKRVLVVEDEDDVRALIVDALRALGYLVQEAADGTVALGMLRSPIRYELLVTDVGLPGMNGRQLADAARESRPNLPVLLMTGYAGTALDRMRVGEDMRILRKPFGLTKLTETVAELLREGVAAG
jgi:CheY-like chemotaxis protein